jgi:non-ribosomal peptide synthase protein (TIGR01720 family)
LGELAEAEVSFNYLGQFDQVLSGGEFRAAAESTGAAQSLENKRPHLIVINGMIGEGQLRMSWGYSEAVHRRETIERVAEQFAEVLRTLITKSQVTQHNETASNKTQDNLLGEWGGKSVKRSNSLLATLRSEGKNLPLFCVSSYGDDPAFVFADLAESLGAEQPFYGLWIPDDEPFSFALLAARHVAEIQRVQPAGPYVVGGYSFGGVVAFEIARQLRARKEEVALLVLLETVGPTIQRDLKSFDDAELAEAIVKHHEAGFRVPESMSELPVDERLTFILNQLKAANIIGPEKDIPAFKAFLEVWRRRSDYTPEAYDGDVLMFRTRGTSILNKHLIHMTPGPSESMDTLGWSMIATSGVKIVKSPGQHSNFIFVPHAAIVAAKLLDHMRPLLQKAGRLELAGN